MLATAKEWLDVEINSIRALVEVIGLGGFEKKYTKKVLRDEFNVPFAITNRLGKEQLIEDREEYDRMCEYKTCVYPRRAEGVTGYRLLVDMALQLPTDMERGHTAAQRGSKALSMNRLWSKKELYAPQLSMLILNALEMKPETVANLVKLKGMV